MELIRGITNLRPTHSGNVATIGNFDGIHRGHGDLIKRLIKAGKTLDMPTLVILFEPQPSEYFGASSPNDRLMRLREKIEIIKSKNIDRLLVLKFDQSLAECTADDFFCKILMEKLDIKHLIIGHDFKFGKGREGDQNFLQKKRIQFDFNLEVVPPFKLDGTRISSTLIRRSLKRGDLKFAECALGYRYFIGGKVCHGHKRGKEWGFPTINLNLNKFKTPLSGIFAVKVEGLSFKKLNGVGYVGSRPIIRDPMFVLEVHLFDFHEVCYGKRVKVEFVEFIRSDMKFDSFGEMAKQVKIDCEIARKILTID